MNANELTPYGEALEKILSLQDLLIAEQREVLRLMVDVEALKKKANAHKMAWIMSEDEVQRLLGDK